MKYVRYVFGFSVMGFIALLMSAIVIVPCLLTSGCLESEKVPLSELPVLNNDLAGGAFVVRSQIPGETFTFCREYSTSYDSSKWRITDSKSLNMKAYITSGDATVLIEHVHCDISLKSTNPSLDGLTQDSMDDNLHTGLQTGFWISGGYPWENIFAIEGFSKDLISGWGFACGDYGYMTISDKRLTEGNLIGSGRVYGNKIQVVYDLLVAHSGDSYFHSRCVIDEFLVPVSE